MTLPRTPFLLAAAASLLGMLTTASAASPCQDAAAEPATEADETPAPQVVVGETDSIWSYLVQKYDTDSDGSISRAEYSRDDATFGRLDRNGDGAVTAEEVEREGGRGGPPSSMMATMVVMRAFGGDAGGRFPTGLTREQLETGAAAMDTDADLTITRVEFDAHMGRRGGGRMPEMDRFGMLLEGVDTGKDGSVSREELLRWFDAADSDKDGQLSMQRRGGRGEGREGPGRGGPDGSSRGARGRQPAGAPEPEAGVGRSAPDFTLQPMNEGEPVTLSSFAGKTPVALIFGSYT